MYVPYIARLEVFQGVQGKAKASACLPSRSNHHISRNPRYCEACIQCTPSGAASGLFINQARRKLWRITFVHTQVP